MKFSIKFLLALLVVGAFLANYFVAQQSKRRIVAEILETQTELDSLTFRKREADGFTPLYETAIRGEKLLLAKYQNAFEENKELPFRVSELKVTNPQWVSYCDLPLLSENSLNHFAFRIYIPPDEKYFLVTDFKNGEKAFASADSHSIQLTPGQHIVDYRYDYGEKKSLELFIDDQKQFSIATLGEQSGFSTNKPPIFQRDLKSLNKPKRLMSLKPSMKPESPQPEQPVMLVHLQGEPHED